MRPYNGTDRKEQAALNVLNGYRMSSFEANKVASLLDRVSKLIERNTCGEVRKWLSDELRLYREIGRIGYSYDYGYYVILLGDRNNINKWEASHDENTIINILLNEMVHSITINSILKDQKKEMLRFRYFVDSTKTDSKSGKDSKVLTENKEYEYDCEYDIRIPWFERHLQILSDLCTAGVVNKSILELETYLMLNNTLRDSDRWKFNTDTKKFEIVST